MQDKKWNIYLSGEIHSNWRDKIEAGIKEKQIPVKLLGPELDHDTSDSCGEQIFGSETNKFWYDHRSARLNTIRTRTVFSSADIVVVKFGEKYKQWNAAFDAGRAIALGKSVITLHSSELDHALKEINAEALATARSAEQVIAILDYVTKRGL